MDYSWLSPRYTIPPLVGKPPCAVCKMTARQQVEQQGPEGVIAVLHQPCQTAIERALRTLGGSVTPLAWLNRQ